MITITPLPKEKKLQLKSRYHPELIQEFKALDGARFDPETKLWTCDYNERNLYSLTTLERFDARYSLTFSFKDFKCEEERLRAHQRDMILQGTHRRRIIIAGEMGVGKTYAAIRILDTLKDSFVWIVTPKQVKQVWQAEIKKWGCALREFNPFDFSHSGSYKFISYHRLEDEILAAPESLQPNHIIFDEAHLLKNPTANRTKAALAITALLRSRNSEAVIILLSGTPTPKDPTDWWSLTEVCQAGYLREGNKHKLASRLGEFETNIGQAGQEYRKLIRWKPEEIHNLYLRLKGLVHIYKKKDCLDLPDKIYAPVYLPFSDDMRTQLKLLTTIQGKGVTVLNKLRQRSDGFQYHSFCSHCSGTGKINSSELGKINCPQCQGEGEATLPVETPKDNQLIADLQSLEEQEQDRVVIYAAYHKSIDKIVEIVKKCGWSFIRLDGRGLMLSSDIDSNNWMSIFSEGNNKKVAFIGHPKAGGLGLNLQSAQLTIFYSNDFDGAARPQAEDRIHRIGTTKAVIKDYLWLPTDYYILQNLLQKKNLQAITLGEIQDIVNTFQEKFYEF